MMEFSAWSWDLGGLVHSTTQPLIPLVTLNEHNLIYPEPIHAIVVHFAIATVLFSVFFDILGVFTRNQSLFNAAWWNLVVASIAIVVAIIFGQFEATLATPSQAAQPVLDNHMAIGWLLAIIIITLTLWRGILRYHPPSRISLIYLGAGLLTVGLVTYQAFLGTQLLWVHGLHVEPVVIAKRLEAAQQQKSGEHKHSEEEENHSSENQQSPQEGT